MLPKCPNNNIAIIPARGGSKRIPKKNIKNFSGKPMIAWSIEAALACRDIHRVIVSTDDAEIASISRQYGAEVPFIRPPELADDYATAFAVAQHAIKWLQKSGGTIDYACIIYATAPFIQANNLNAAYKQLVASNKDYIFSVTSFPFPIQRGVRINAAGEIEALHAEHFYTRSQDLEECYHDAGQFYWGTPEAFLNNIILHSTAALPFVLPRYLVQDIDTPEDWRRAELMHQALLQTGELGQL
jgi:pseudaminic acid cytidylyltransferase